MAEKGGDVVCLGMRLFARSNATPARYGKTLWICHGTDSTWSGTVRPMRRSLTGNGSLMSIQSSNDIVRSLSTDCMKVTAFMQEQIRY